MSTLATAGRALTPIEQQIETLAAGMGASADQPAAGFRVGDLVALLGQNSHTLLILVFSVLNMIPGPPGYGGTVAIAIMGAAIATVPP